jgi:hypothetical protein
MLPARHMLRVSAFRLAVSLLVSVSVGACERFTARDQPDPSPSAPVSSAVPLPSPRPARPVSSEALAVSRLVQATKLPVPPAREHAPRLAFGRGVLGQLTDQALLVYDTVTFELLATHPLEHPRVLLALADGALLAIGTSRMLRFEPANRRATPLQRPPLLLGDVYADAQLRDRIWVFDGSGSERLLGPPKLSSFRLVEGASSVPLPEQTIQLGSPRGGVFGPTRDGVWLYLTPKRGERFSPAGLRLPGLNLPDVTLPVWVLKAERLDQCLWLEENGALSRALVTPPFKQLFGGKLAVEKLSGTPYSAAVADNGQLLAVTVVTGPGPHFALELRDAKLQPVARVDLPSDAPTGGDDWLKVVTANQRVVASATKPLVAVGGPSRLLVFRGSGERIFSIPSR